MEIFLEQEKHEATIFASAKIDQWPFYVTPHPEEQKFTIARFKDESFSRLLLKDLLPQYVKHDNEKECLSDDFEKTSKGGILRKVYVFGENFFNKRVVQYITVYVGPRGLNIFGSLYEGVSKEPNGISAGPAISTIEERLMIIRLEKPEKPEKRLKDVFIGRVVNYLYNAKKPLHWMDVNFNLKNERYKIIGRFDKNKIIYHGNMDASGKRIKKLKFSK